MAGEPEMVERVAYAMHMAVLPHVPWPSSPGYVDTQYACARAAIKAMREPLSSMSAAIGYDDEFNTEEAENCWRIMIDAALTTEEAGG